MRRRLAAWASVGFLVACCWVLYTVAIPVEQLIPTMREPVVEALAFVSCPIVSAALYFHFPLHFWWVPPINAATYAVVGFSLEILRRYSRTLTACVGKL